MEIRTANVADLSEIQKLLVVSGLLVDDVSASLIKGFLVAEDVRGTGIARELVVRLEDKVRACGPLDVWLLTTTAEHFFERAGYERVVRNDVPGEVQLCRQFAVLCPSTATCMRKRLGPMHSYSIVERPLSN